MFAGGQDQRPLIRVRGGLPARFPPGGRGPVSLRMLARPPPLLRLAPPIAQTAARWDPGARSPEAPAGKPVAGRPRIRESKCSFLTRSALDPAGRIGAPPPSSF